MACSSMSMTCPGLSLAMTISCRLASTEANTDPMGIPITDLVRRSGWVRAKRRFLLSLGIPPEVATCNVFMDIRRAVWSRLFGAFACNIESGNMQHDVNIVRTRVFIITDLKTSVFRSRGMSFRKSNTRGSTFSGMSPRRCARISSWMTDVLLNTKTSSIAIVGTLQRDGCVNTMYVDRTHLRDHNPPEGIRDGRIYADKIKLNGPLREPLH